jgi:hypothetical protein
VTILNVLPFSVLTNIGTELDEHGNVRVGMQAFKKIDLCTMVPSSLLSLPPVRS